MTLLKSPLFWAAIAILTVIAWGEVRYSTGKRDANEAVIRDTVTVRDTFRVTVVSPAVVRPSRSSRPSAPPPARLDPQELPWPLVYTIDTLFAVTSENASVSGEIHAEFDPRTKSFLLEFSPIVEFTRPRVNLTIVESRRDPWWLRPIGVLGACAMTYGIMEKNPYIAGAGAAATFYSLVVEF